MRARGSRAPRPRLCFGAVHSPVSTYRLYFCLSCSDSCAAASLIDVYVIALPLPASQAHQAACALNSLRLRRHALAIAGVSAL